MFSRYFHLSLIKNWFLDNSLESTKYTVRVSYRIEYDHVLYEETWKSCRNLVVRVRIPRSMILRTIQAYAPKSKGDGLSCFGKANIFVIHQAKLIRLFSVVTISVSSLILSNLHCILKNVITPQFRITIVQSYSLSLRFLILDDLRKSDVKE